MPFWLFEWLVEIKLINCAYLQPASNIWKIESAMILALVEIAHVYIELVEMTVVSVCNVHIWFGLSLISHKSPGFGCLFFHIDFLMALWSQVVLLPSGQVSITWLIWTQLWLKDAVFLWKISFQVISFCQSCICVMGILHLTVVVNRMLLYHIKFLFDMHKLTHFVFGSFVQFSLRNIITFLVENLTTLDAVSFCVISGYLQLSELILEWWKMNWITSQQICLWAGMLNWGHMSWSIKRWIIRSLKRNFPCTWWWLVIEYWFETMDISLEHVTLPLFLVCLMFQIFQVNLMRFRLIILSLHILLGLFLSMHDSLFIRFVRLDGLLT